MTTQGLVGLWVRFSRQVTLQRGADVTDAVQLLVNMATACAVRRDGRVLCWGNTFGQLGDWTRRDRPSP